MDTSNHNSMKTLFDQLGLPSGLNDIETFMAAHKLATDQRIENADFWTSSQANFLRDAISDDADWAEVVDHLDAGLRQ